MHDGGTISVNKSGCHRNAKYTVEYVCIVWWWEMMKIYCLHCFKIWLGPPKSGLPHENCVVGWLVVLRIYVALAIYQPYRDLGVKSLKSKRRGQESNPGALAPQAKSLTTNHYTTAAPGKCVNRKGLILSNTYVKWDYSETSRTVPKNVFLWHFCFSDT